MKKEKTSPWTHEAGRPLYRLGAHCNIGRRNFIGIGVCLEGNLSESKVPDAQLAWVREKSRQLLLLVTFKLRIGDIELH